MDIPKRTIDILLFDDFNLLDVAGPAEAFSNARVNGERVYSVCYMSVDGQPVGSSSGLRVVPDKKASAGRYQSDLLVPGGSGVDAAIVDQHIGEFLRSWARQRRQQRCISICSGALLIAQAGLLDGLQATTHWTRELQASQQYPDVNWCIDQIYTMNEHTFSSAGVTTGIDLALSIIRMDCGPDVALSVARELVVSLKRAGGQGQYAELLASQFSADSMLEQLTQKLHQNPAQTWTLESMAGEVGVTSRTLSRRFNQLLGESPVRVLEKIRVSIASALLAEGLDAQRVQTKTGFSSDQTMQRAFKKHLGVTVGEYRKQFVTQIH